jgi:gliding motility-associated-like protein
MRLFALIFQFFFSTIFPLFNQTEGWTSTCMANFPSVVEMMIDACGDDNEFYREYVVLKSGVSSFHIENYNLRVTNPANNAFVGSVKVEKGFSKPDVIDKLNAANTACGYGISFRDVFAAPYYGNVPPNSKILIFNNKDSVDLDFLGSRDFSSLCGSKVFVALGTVRPQSPNTPIFRNFPRNRNCGTTGCLRKAEFQYEGIVTPACQQVTYDFLKLPSPAVIRPNDEFGDGSYIRPKPDGTIGYGGGGPNGTSTVCMPPTSLMCTIPAMPDYGVGFWNVLAYDGLNNFTNFKGYYQAKGNHPTSITAPVGSFEYNTARDGWKPYQAPSEAHPTYGALSAYDGCDVKADSFSIIAKRKGFPCGNYNLRLVKYDDYTRIRVDVTGDGTWEYDNAFNAPACATGCNTVVWQGNLNSDTRIEIWSYDIKKEFNTTLVFEKNPTGNNPLIIGATTTPTPCNGTTGGINLAITGGTAPFSTTWTGTTPIANNAISGANLASGIYQVVVKDASGCYDTARILVPQTNTIIAQAGKDTAYCAGGTAILRGSASGGTGALTYEWSAPNTIPIQNQTATVNPSIPTSYVLKVTDANGCFKTDTVLVNVRDLPFMTMTVSTRDTVCNNEVPILKVKGANTYTWSTIPPIAGAALSSTTGDSVALFALFLPAPQYRIMAQGTGANGCINSLETTIVIRPLPNVTIDPINDTLCTTGGLRTLTASPATGGRFYAINPFTGDTCKTCIVNGNQFNPSIAGVGKYTIYYELVDDVGCRNSPSFEIKIKACAACPKPDSTMLTAFTCDPTKVGASSLNLKKVTNGCDSVVVTMYILSPVDTTKINLKTCDPTKEGIVITKLKNSYNCDSVVLTTTKWVKSDTTNINRTSCNPADTGTTRRLLQSVGGCDSLIFTTTRLVKSDTTNINRTSCNPADTGTIRRLLQSIGGCDSLVFTITKYAKADTTNLNSTSCNPLDTGTTRRVLRNIGGCDSLVISKITLSLRDSTKLTATTCDVSKVGVVTQRLVNRYGCDSIIVTTTTLNKNDTTRVNLTSCNPRDTGTVIKRVLNRFGCDSVHITRTILTNGDTTKITAKTCDPTQVGRVTFRQLVKASGCDSIVQTTLILNRRDSVAIRATICAGDSIKLGANWLKTTGIFPATLKNTEGCDSIVVINLTVTKGDTTFINKTSCNLINVGEKAVALKNTRGCDSIIVTRTAFQPITMAIQIQTTRAITCASKNDGEINLKVLSGGKAPYMPRWLTGDTTTTLRNIRAGTYYVTVTDADGCQSRDSFTLKEPPPLSIQTAGIAPKCFENTSGSLRIDNIAGGVGTYRLESNIMTKKLDTLPALVPNIPVGNFTFKILDKNNCPLDTMIEIKQGRKLLIALNNSATIDLGSSHVLDATVSNDISTLKWTPPAGLKCDSCLTTVATPITSTVYTLNVTDTEGCKARNSISIAVDKKRRVYAPTSFSPNGDGENDVFMLYSDSSVKLVSTFRIFNRWGALVYATEKFLTGDTTKGWDGTFNGKQLPPDVFVFYAEIEFKDGKKEMVMGDITLMR